MIDLLAAIVSLFVSAQDAEALRRTAPHYLTASSAEQHLAAARVAELATGVDADLLLSVAWHESRFGPTVVTAEPGGLVSCGVMTPVPKKRCHAHELTLGGGYLAGALHLRGWFDACRGSQRCALQGYAGGFALIRVCFNAPNDRRCAIADVFLDRAAWIRRETLAVAAVP